MLSVELPRIEGNTRLRDAIEVLKRSNYGAFVTERPSGPAVIDIDVVVHELRLGRNVMVKALKPRFRAVQLPSATRAATLMSPTRRLETESLMDAGRAACIVTRFMGGKAEVLTRHESYVSILGSTPDLWQCTQVSKHIWFTKDLDQPGNLCPNDGNSTVPV